MESFAEIKTLIQCLVHAEKWIVCAFLETNSGNKNMFGKFTDQMSHDCADNVFRSMCNAIL